jgi:xylose isomerase
MTVGAVGKSLYLARECGENVGVVIDFGHALMAKEKPAESAVILLMNNKLFNVHMNDAYGDWDDDMIAVSVHLQESLEFFYYLDEMKYDGWIGLDIFPFRMDGRTAADLCIQNLKSLEIMLDRLDRKKLKYALESIDAGNSQKLIRDTIFANL